MATDEQIMNWMEDGYLNGFAECVIGDLAAGMDFHAYYGWQTESTEELDAVGFWGVVTDYLGNKSLETFDTREEMEEHQQALEDMETRFWFPRNGPVDEMRHHLWPLEENEEAEDIDFSILEDEE